MTDHAIFSPSKAERWLACPGSVRLTAHAPPAPVSEYALEGIRMHELAARCIVEQLDPEQHAPEGMSKSAIEAVSSYVQMVLEYKATYDGPFFVEQRLTYNEHLFGTADFIGRAGYVLDVWDFKGGQGVIVSAKDNAQMKTYAWLAWQDANTMLAVRGASQVRMRIIQPRVPQGSPVKEETFDVLELAAWGRFIKALMSVALGPDAPLNTGPHCRWCPAAPTCPKLTEETARVLSRGPEGMTGGELAQALDRAEQVELWVESVRAYATDQLGQGALIPGWCLRPKRGIRKWENDSRAVQALEMLGVKPWTEPVLISPAQAEKQLKGKLPEGLTKIESSGYTLDRGEGESLADKARIILNANTTTKG